tara:strand:+ start:112728 stop:112928 length:201 start_codon:yes stop_codon:yes gene_type:complete
MNLKNINNLVMRCEICELGILTPANCLIIDFLTFCQVLGMNAFSFCNAGVLRSDGWASYNPLNGEM